MTQFNGGIPIPRSDQDWCSSQSSSIPPHSEHESYVGTPTSLKLECCGRSFTRRTDLARHMTTMHSNARYDCTIPGCHNNRGKGYCRPDKVREHLWKHHSDRGFKKHAHKWAKIGRMYESIIEFYFLVFFLQWFSCGFQTVLCRSYGDTSALPLASVYGLGRKDRFNIWDGFNFVFLVLRHARFSFRGWYHRADVVWRSVWYQCGRYVCCWSFCCRHCLHSVCHRCSLRLSPFLVLCWVWTRFSDEWWLMLILMKEYTVYL